MYFNSLFLFFFFFFQSNCSCLPGFQNFSSGTGCSLIKLCENGGGCNLNANCTMEGPGVKRCDNCVVVMPLFKLQWMFCFHKTDCTCNMMSLWETVPWKFQSYVGTNIFGRTKVVVKKCWQAYATPAISKLFGNLCLQSLALTKVSFNDFPLWYDSIGGSWNISFRYGWFWIRCHFPISIFLTLGKAGWYCVTKGNIFFFVLLSLFSRDLFLPLKLTSKRCFSKNSFGYSSVLLACFETLHVFIKRQVWRICS